MTRPTGRLDLDCEMVASMWEKRRRGGVWIVLDDAPDAPQSVLGVFATQEEASTFVEAHVPQDFEELVYTHYAVGWTYEKGSSRYSG